MFMNNKYVMFINKMSRSDFHSKIVRKIAKTRAFGALVTFGAKALNANEKNEIEESLCNIDPLFSCDISDTELDEIATAIASRSVKLL